MSDNLELWNKLGRTDPEQTKAFTRGGGFKGTAIKPIYTEQKMTEEFGPCGVGWGINEPTYQVVTGHNSEVMVYCTVSIWIDQGGKISAPIFGVGGDKIVSYVKPNEQYKRPERWENDDEAFKKAFTDAVGNAMKHLGMSADVHMGRFDDSKYVAELRAEANAPGKFATPEPKAKSRDLFSTVLGGLRTAGNKSKAELRAYWTSETFVEAYETFPEDWQQELTAEKDAFLASYAKPTGGRVDPNESLDQQYKDTVGA